MRKLFWGVMAVSMLAVGACSRGEGSPLRASARSLYERSAELTLRYIDSLKQAGDSAKVNHLSERFENLLTKLNYEYPEDTDTEMSESENDTLKRLSERYVDLRDSLLKRFGGLDSLGHDTTPLFIPYRLEPADTSTTTRISQ